MPNINSELYILHAWEENPIYIKCVQGEGGIKIAKFKLVDDSGAINLSSATSVTFDGIKRDGSGCCVTCNIVDATNGIIEFIEQTGITDIDGNVNGTINAVFPDGNIKFDGITLHVAPNNTTKLIEASQTFSTFVEALNKLALITPEGTIALDDALLDDGINAVQGKVIKAALDEKLDNSEGSVKRDNIDVNAVGTDKIADKAVTNGKIANGAITATKIAVGAVSGSNIAQGQIGTNHLQNGIVTIDKLADGVKTSINGKADKATTLAGYGIIDGENIGNKVTKKGSVTDESVNYPSIKYLNDYYYDFDEVNDELANKLDNTAGAVLSDNIAGGAVKTDKIADKAVTNGKIANGAITATKIAVGAVSGSNIAQGQIGTNHLQNGVITAEKLDSVLMSKINNKYNSSNIEEGSSDLTPYSGSEAAIKSAKCLYTKIGKRIICNIKIVMNEFSMKYNYSIHLTNLPFATSLPDKLSFIAITNDKGYLRASLNISSAWVSILNNTGNVINFAEDDTIDCTVLYNTK